MFESSFLHLERSVQDQIFSLECSQINKIQYCIWEMGEKSHKREIKVSHSMFYGDRQFLKFKNLS